MYIMYICACIPYACVVPTWCMHHGKYSVEALRGPDSGLSYNLVDFGIII
jgi:hypothetical protein